MDTIVIERFSKPKYNLEHVLALATVTVNGVTVKHYKVQKSKKPNSKPFAAWPTKGYKEEAQTLAYIKDPILAKKVFAKILSEYWLWVKR